MFDFKIKAMKGKLVKQGKSFHLISEDESGGEFVVATTSEVTLKYLSKFPFFILFLFLLQAYGGENATSSEKSNNIKDSNR